MSVNPLVIADGLEVLKTGTDIYKVKKEAELSVHTIKANTEIQLNRDTLSIQHERNKLLAKAGVEIAQHALSALGTIAEYHQQADEINARREKAKYEHEENIEKIKTQSQEKITAMKEDSRKIQLSLKDISDKRKNLNHLINESNKELQEILKQLQEQKSSNEAELQKRYQQLLQESQLYKAKLIDLL